MLLIVALGVLVGLTMALTGAGGGVMAVPLLIFGLGMPVADAAPVALLAVGISAGLGTYFGLRTAHVRYRAAGFMAALGFAGALLGAWLSHRIANAPLMLAFAVLLAYTSAQMLLRARSAAEQPGGRGRSTPAPCALDPAVGRLRWTPACARALGAAGFVAGTLSALLGVGGGFVIVPTLMRVTDLDMKSIVATSLAVIALLATASVLLYSAAGHPLQWETALPFAAGAILGLLAGRTAARHLAGAHVQQAFALFGLLVSALMAYRSGLIGQFLPTR